MVISLYLINEYSNVAIFWGFIDLSDEMQLLKMMVY